jgi:hypothetical protein
MADGVIEAANSLGLSTTVSSKSGCPFIEKGHVWPAENSCEDWQGQMLNYALTTRPKVVVIANRSSGYVNKEWGWATLSKVPGGQPVPSTPEAAVVWERALSAISQKLQAEGIGVIVVNPIPDINNRSDSGGGATIISDVFQWTEPHRIQATRLQAERARELALKAERVTASRITGVVLFDPIPVLCDSIECPKIKDGLALYLDWGHLTREGSLLLAPSLVETIQEAIEKK